ncbi:hypothetical protein chiPu_0021542 [Chiloscyllium punctatum]|uniref:Uncharacterized protein n=1 Tax=Chiloscyllium punctatum TaxID=137246 RepID=A0A401RH60_CHIPU|nr:hypothetical protein [Chiloscyllium punctatum]
MTLARPLRRNGSTDRRAARPIGHVRVTLVLSKSSSPAEMQVLTQQLAQRVLVTGSGSCADGRPAGT